VKIDIKKTLTADAVVVGGGTAGIAAAVAAARSGLKVILIEQHGFCGGLTVFSMVHVLDGVLAQSDFSKLAVGGIAVELLNRMIAINGAGPPDNPPETPVFDPEAFKLVADGVLRECGVKCLYHTRMVNVVARDGRISEVVVHSKADFWSIRANYFIDASGDGDLCAAAAADFEISKSAQPMTLHFQLAGLKGDKTWKQLEKETHQVLQAAFEAGRGPRFGGPWILRIRPGEISMNCTRLYGNPLDPEDLTAAEISGRLNAWKIWELLKQALPEFADSHIVTSGPSVGARETRRVIGDYQLTENDVLTRTSFHDAVGLGAWPLDVHPSDGRVGYHPHKENPPPPYAFPLRALLPKRLENAFVVGRCASATHRAHGSSRVNGTSMMMGQAAGVACGLAAKGGKAIRDVPINQLQDSLVQAGAILDPDKLPSRPAHWRLGEV
jgi:hypothetical protein